MRQPELRLGLDVDEIIVDSFAGGGGASMGMEMAFGRSPDIAINHDAEAIALHRENHPGTRHFCEDVWAVDPVKACGGRRVGLFWLSPDCKHFSKAKGGKPVEKKIRGLAWIACRWAKALGPNKPRVIVLENVEEFADWGPLDDDNMPCRIRKGMTFRRFVKQLSNLGYTVDWQVMRASDYGAPTIRKRLFLVARCDGQPITWPEKTHGPGLLPYRTAAECIDWTVPCPSIFERKKPLAENTLRRIARGMFRYVINCADPFIVPTTHQGDARTHGIDEPLRTITGAQRGEMALVLPVLHKNNDVAEKQPGHSLFSGAENQSAACFSDDAADPGQSSETAGDFQTAPFLAGVGGRKGQSPETPVDQPYHTVTAKADTVLVTPYLARIGQTGGNGKYANDARDPLTTITSKNEHLLVSPTLIQMGYGERPEQWRCEDCQYVYDRADLPVCGCVKCGSEKDPTLIPGQQPRVPGIDKPLGTVVAGGGKFALVSAFLAKHYGDQWAGKKASDAREPLPTITGRGTQLNIVTSSLIKLRNNCIGQPVDEPLHTITAAGGSAGGHFAEVRAFLVKYYGTDQNPRLTEPLHTIPTKDRFGLVTVHGHEYVIADIGMRMLMPRELFTAQGFPTTYKINFADGKPVTKTAQIRMCGNSVSPPNAAAILRALLTQKAIERSAA